MIEKMIENVGIKGKRKLLEVEPRTQQQLTIADFSDS